MPKTLMDFEPQPMEVLINYVRNIPDLYLERKHGIILDFAGHQVNEAMKALRKEYFAKALWLEYYLQDRNEHLPELTSTDKISYKPHAEMTVSFFKLAQEVYLRDDWAQQNIPSPATWMVLCEFCLCKTAMINSGYLTGKPNSFGKAEVLKQAVKHYNGLLDTVHIQLQEPGDEKCNALESLEQSAALIAKDDIHFRNKYYNYYIKNQKRCFTEIRNNPKLHVLTFTPDGEPKILGKSKGKRELPSSKNQL